MGISGTGPGDSQLNARKYDYGVDIFDYGVQAIRAGLKFGSVWGFEDSMHVQHNEEILQLIMISRYGDFGMNLAKKWQLKMLSIMLREELIQ